jgi:raffinose/stachyose/melibiose transport system permease protein
MDGASSFRILRSILLPQARPALTTLCLLVFMYTWNEFLLALVMLQGSSATTAPLGLSYFAGATRAGDPTKVAAAAVLVATPVVLVYIILQRHFIRGVLAGAIKE